MTQTLDLTGQRYGRLTVTAYAGRIRMPGGDTKRVWECRCDCGTSVNVVAASLRRGASRSCGCWKRELVGAKNLSHGDCRRSVQPITSEYSSWAEAKRRCYTPTTRAYDRYGGRGIRMCDAWRNDYAAFLRDMGRKPTPQHEIDRIDVNGHYEPGNCRWALPVEQANNKRSSRYVEVRGERLTIAEATTRYGNGLTQQTVLARIRTGWSVERALSEPVKT